MVQNPFDDNGGKGSRHQKEYKLQTHIVKKHAEYFPHVIMTSFPGRPGDAQDGFFKKQLGVRAGVTDILLWWSIPNPYLRDSKDYIPIRIIQAGVVEIKVDAAVSSAQNKFMSAIRHIGGKDGVAHSWQEYYKLLCGFGIKPTEVCTIFDEPDYSTKQEKFHAAWEAFKP